MENKYPIRLTEEGFLPLKKDIVVEKHYTPNCLYVPAFDLTILPGYNETQVKEELTKRYYDLEHKAARGTLDEDETKQWHTIVEYVDRRKLARQRELNNSIRGIWGIVESQGKRYIQSVCNLCFTLPESELDKLKEYDNGTYFEADYVYGEGDREVVSINNIKLRPDFREINDEEFARLQRFIDGGRSLDEILSE